ncbi:hypothetical protein TrRE_jg2606 [Triparma retinervis]|uniref:Uncharacterized protein n=1 Tax=Triparma retinervis TaxID=2557542 RepID=A0A9W7DLU2_9STRA|nr:hypothetical protein TrRE_jg2606 [Triparma retinervis]
MEDRLKKLNQTKEEELRDKLSALKGQDSSMPPPTHSEIVSKLATLGVAVGVGVPSGRSENFPSSPPGASSDVDELINQALDAASLSGLTLASNPGSTSFGHASSTPPAGETLSTVLTSLDFGLKTDEEELSLGPSPPLQQPSRATIGKLLLVSELMNCVSNMTATGEDGEQIVLDGDTMKDKVGRARELLGKLAGENF